ncbi:cytochrome c oxidase subunit 4 [Actinokineospora globicatena]|uniref:Cytochrome c oxidase polypeptide 4 n=1 Tax=Actinokineospora globicatena TaxID=103729 RepID=A0A9W6VA19_9PSEU|nr:cytochrome c oxidase subunit 4 [Actinokineospora globicatena]MCP2302488.1 Cytochrome c oxidase subunit IV [Actinokineospora globicatena]GLW75828.1 cytochrome c oxidase polypeptide 4 [Actinokineospora globicatena]GLW82666.1 cytochrome c oxidase polypeptide 4 [Actinokineospora globicatena]GLW91611.1 cytochrome c oxidase polypeptide 4 [Actinokineospora globicatena]
MKVEARLFDITTAFFFLSAIVYGVWAKEPVGTVALILTGGLSLIVGTYFHFIARRLEQRPEDNPDAEVSDGAGELGFFSPGSYWPVALAASAAVTAFAMAFWQIWLLVIGVVLILLTVGGLVFEYHTRPNSTD